MLTTLQHEQSLPFQNLNDETEPFPKLNDETDRPFALFIKLYPELAEIQTHDQCPGQGDIICFADKEIARKNPPTFGAFYRWYQREQKRMTRKVLSEIKARSKIHTIAIVDEDLPTFLGGTKRESI